MEFTDGITILSGKNRYPVNVRIIFKKIANEITVGTSRHNRAPL